MSENWIAWGRQSMLKGNEKYSKEEPDYWEP